MSSPAGKPCKYVDVCALPAAFTPNSQDWYCILHSSDTQGKNIADFQQALDTHLRAGRCSFRHFCFPDGLSDVDFTGRTFSTEVDFTDVVFRRSLILANATFEDGLVIEGVDFDTVTLAGAHVRGPFRLKANTVRGYLLLTQATFEGPVEIEVTVQVRIEANRAKFAGHVAFRTSNFPAMYFIDTEFSSGLLLHGRCEAERKLHHVSVVGTLDWHACHFNGDLQLSDCAFHPDSILNLDYSAIGGELLLTGSYSNLPSEIRLNATVVRSNVRIEARLGAPHTRLIADKAPPQFDGEVSLANVDLSTFHLLGNVLDRFKFSSITWAQRFRRSVLYDELRLRRGERIPLGNLKEAYQVLKQRCQENGNHRLAGDFHYGEMEVQRRQYRWPWRLVSWEGLYWALNGYGTGHIRAFMILLAIIAGFGVLFWWSSPDAFAHRSLLEALRYSVSVAALQRPEVPWEFGRSGKWLHVLEAVLGPIQIALFVLALRMRMKR